MTLALHDTLAGAVRPFEPRDPDRVTMYVCGPTVYGRIHIGNARPAVVFDVLYRLLRFRYASVVYARNFTDIDDKIMAAAKAEGSGVAELAARYADRPASHYIRRIYARHRGLSAATTDG